MKKKSWKLILILALVVVLAAGSVGGYFALAHQNASQILDHTQGGKPAGKDLCGNFGRNGYGTGLFCVRGLSVRLRPVGPERAGKPRSGRCGAGSGVYPWQGV